MGGSRGGRVGQALAVRARSAATSRRCGGTSQRDAYLWLRFQNPGGRAAFSGPGWKRRVPAASRPPAPGFFRPGPNIRVHGRGADAAGVRSIPARRSTAAGLRNPRPAGQWDKHFSGKPNPASVRLGEPSLVNCERTPYGLWKAMSMQGEIRFQSGVGPKGLKLHQFFGRVACSCSQATS